jgi:hypothetical protein
VTLYDERHAPRLLDRLTTLMATTRDPGDMGSLLVGLEPLLERLDRTRARYEHFPAACSRPAHTGPFPAAGRVSLRSTRRRRRSAQSARNDPRPRAADSTRSPP